MADSSVDTSKLTLAEPAHNSPVPAPDLDVTPRVNPFLRSPLPPINATPDTLRQFYVGGVPQMRVMPPNPVSSTGPKGATGDTGAKGAAVIASPTIKSTMGQLKRETVPLTTATLAPGAVEKGTVPLGKTFSLMSITASSPCRVRLYSSSAQCDADVAAVRGVADEPVAFSQHGVIFDWNTQESADSISGRSIVTVPATRNASHTVLDLRAWLRGFIPTVGLPCLPGQTVSVTYLSGLCSIGASGEYGDPDVAPPIFPFVDANGFSGTIPPPTNSGELCISFYTAFGDDAGHSVDFETPIGNSWTGVVPQYPTATEDAYALYLGLDDGGGLGDNYGSWQIQVDIGTPSYPNYPVTFICSPEALGSDKNALPTGAISYAIDNLGVLDAAITVNFEILREEK